MLTVVRALAVLASAAATVASASGQVVISQVDGAGGLTTASVPDPFDRDFVELFNRGTTPVNLNGWSLQLWGDTGSATTAATPSWDVIPLSGTILPGQYLLVAPSFQRGSLGSSVTTQPLPAPDIMGPVYDGAVLVTAINAVALMSTTTQIPAGQCPSGPNLVDLFRYAHPNGSCFEGTAAPPNVTGLDQAVFRNSGGCDDTNNNAGDLTTNQTPTPRNSDTNVFVTTSSTPNSVIAGTGGPIVITATRGNSTCNPIAVPLSSATANLSAFGLSASQPLFDNGSNGDAVSGDGVYSVQFNITAAQAAGTYVIPVSGTGGSTTLASSVRVRVLPPAASNDFCASAINLTNPSGINILTGPYATTVNALNASGDGIDAGTCNGDTEVKYSVWYSVTTGSQAGALHITESSSEDVVFSLHNSCGGASLQCANREDIGFPLGANTTYFIQVGRETGAFQAPQVPYILTFEFLPTPGNDVECSATPIASFPFSASPFAPAYTNEASFNISCDTTSNPTARHGAWYTFTTGPNPGVLEYFESSINSTNFTLFTGASCAGLSEYSCRDESLSGAVSSPLSPNTQYWLLVSVDSSATTIPSVAYNFTINFNPSPVNDNCSGAVDLNTVGLPYATSVAARYASTDANAPSTTSGSIGCSTTLVTRNAGVWYTYTTGPTASGTLRVADVSSQDVFYAVFTGSCGSLAPNQCGGLFTADDIFIQLTPNTTYYILVSLASTTANTLATGNYDLTFALFPTPANDLACNATLVTSSLHDQIAGPAATPDVDVSCNYNIPAQSSTGYGVWYRFAPSTPKLLYARQSASDVLVYGLFTGPNCSALSEIGCRMGSNGNLSDNFAYFELQGGVEYWLLVGKISNSSPFGLYDLTIELQDPHGACCSGTTCTVTTQAACAGSFRGTFTTCGDTPSIEESPAAPIPDSTAGTGGTPGVLVRTLNVPSGGTVSDVKVLVDLTHARVGDLIMTIQGPTGGIQDLIRRIDDDNDRICPTQGQQGRLTDLGGAYIFDDQAFNPYGPTMVESAKYFDFTGLVVLPGHYKPTTCNEDIVSLNSVFAGQPMTGTWTLTITDNQSSSIGTLNRWGLILNGGATPPCNCRADFNGNGSVTVQDIFDFLAAYFTGSPSADVNGVGGVTVQDIFDFLAFYFTGC